MIVLVKPSPPPVTELDSGALEKLKVNIFLVHVFKTSREMKVTSNQLFH